MNFNKFIQNMYFDTEIYRKKMIKETIKRYGPYENFLDIGCWDGSTTLDFISQTEIKNLHGVEPVKEIIEEAINKGIKIKSFFVDRDCWDYEDNYFDCIHSSEVIEHISNVDFFIENCHKKLKPGGYLITTTNNLASLHNMFSLIMGWAPMDLTNASVKSLSIGNPLSIHKNEKFPEIYSTWVHKCIYTPYWLKAWMEIYDFEFVELVGSGLYPFPPQLGSMFTNHSVFFTLVMKKNIKV
jgi:SAM-dependent methyltransferase